MIPRPAELFRAPECIIFDGCGWGVVDLHVHLDSDDQSQSYVDVAFRNRQTGEVRQFRFQEPCDLSVTEALQSADFEIADIRARQLETQKVELRVTCADDFPYATLHLMAKDVAELS